LRVAWLTAFPTHPFAERLSLLRNIISHPETWITNLAQALVKNSKIELHIITLSKWVSVDQTLTDDNITYHFLKIPNFPRALLAFQYDRLRLRSALNRIQPDLVHSHGTEQGYSYAAVSTNFPCLISIQGIINEIYKSRSQSFDEATLRLRITSFFERYTIKRGKYFIAKTPFAAHFIKRICPQAVVFNIENPMNPVFFEVDWKGQASSTLIFVGTLVQEKGVEELIKAIAILRDNHPEIRLEFIGWGTETYINTLKKRAHALNLNDYIDFVGFQTSKQIAEKLSKSFMLVLPSYMDTSPNVVSEAMVVGIPIVATNVGGIPDMIKDAQTGMLVPPQDPKSLASAIQTLLQNRDQAVSMAQQAIQEGRKRFQPDQIAQKYLYVYERIIAESGLPVHRGKNH